MDSLYFKGKKYIFKDNQLLEDNDAKIEVDLDDVDVDLFFNNLVKQNNDSSIADSSTLYALDNIVLPTVNP